jgi:hypothetical protein
MVLSIALFVYRNDLKTIKKQYKNSSKLVDIEERQVSKKRNHIGNDQCFELRFLLYYSNIMRKVPLLYPRHCGIGLVRRKRRSSGE